MSMKEQIMVRLAVMDKTSDSAMFLIVRGYKNKPLVEHVLKVGDARDAFLMMKKVGFSKAIEDAIVEKDFKGNISLRAAMLAPTVPFNTERIRRSLQIKNPKSPYLRDWSMKVWATGEEVRNAYAG